jgi:hypothetical protein
MTGTPFWLIGHDDPTQTPIAPGMQEESGGGPTRPFVQIRMIETFALA